MQTWITQELHGKSGDITYCYNYKQTLYRRLKPTILHFAYININIKNLKLLAINMSASTIIKSNILILLN